MTEIFLTIQYLRFLAALMVVFFHATQSLHRDLGLSALPNFLQGARGVDIFFVISGFIIAHVSKNAKYSGWDFLVRRFVRVAPPYYAASAVMLMIALLAPNLLNSTLLSWPHVIASFLFIPWDNPVTHGTFPLLQVGWTLNAEMQFYLLFALAFTAPLMLRVFAATLILFSIVTTGLLLGPQNETLSALSDPILLEFIFGMFIALALDRRLIPRSKVLGLILFSIGMGLILGLPSTPDTHGWRFLIAGLPAAMILFGLLMIEQATPIRNIKTLKLLGDSSYSLYLWHFFIIGAARFAWRYTDISGALNDILFLITVVLTSILASIVGYICIERPLVGFASRLRGDKIV